jgi:hypothetical protein
MVRRLIAQKKPLQEICEMTIQRCCAPDADTGAGIGCDNMTMVLVAILNGKSLDQWYDWITDRVERKYGYETPVELPQVFSESRILAAQNRAQFRNSSSFGPTTAINLRGPGGFSALARVLGGTGLTFNPSARTTNDPNVLSFGHDDDDEYDDDDDEEDAGDTGEGGLFGVNRLKVGASGDGKDKTSSLRNQLDDLESGLHDDDEMDHDHGENGANKMETDSDESLPRANITLASPTEKQGMIDLDIVQDNTGNLSPYESGFANDGKSWIKVSSPAARSEVSSIGSPLIPIPPSLKDFGKPLSGDKKTPEAGTKEEGKETPPPPALNTGAIAEDKVPEQETGRVPDADAHKGLTNGLLDKSEDPIKAS